MAEETKNTKPADEEIEKTAEPTAGEEKQPETEKAESDTAAAKEEQPEKKGFFGKKKEKKDKKDEQIEELTDRLKRQMAEFDNFRKRTEKEKAAMFEVGAKSVIEKMLPVIDVEKEVADAVDCPLVVEGCKNVEKDAELLPKVAEALQGRNALILSEKEENYKAIGAAAGLAYNQIVGAESAVDINLAKQLNVVTTQLGVDAKKIVMNIGSAAAGYGYEYVVSTMDRIKGAALGQNDNMLQMPIITPVSAETWNVKEATASEKDMPEWGPQDERGIDMEVETAAADLAAGSDAVILRHPESVKTISKLIKALA